MLRVWNIVSLLIGLVLAGSVYASEQAAENVQHVVLLSIDGFRHDYIELHQAARIAAIADQGVRAKSLTPVYPANTFPNHLSIVTGLLPKHHGIVNNAFLDKQRPAEQGYANYHMGKGYTDSSWLSGIPLWNLVELHGNKAATYFWPESDARINGLAPTYHYHYSKYADYQQRIDQIVNWLSLPAASRPQFVAGYFSLVDTYGHEYGPQSSQTAQAVQRMDALIGQLYERLQALPVAVNLVLVSDHGMLEVKPKAAVVVSQLAIDKTQFAWVNNGSQLHIYARSATPASEIRALATRLNQQSALGFTVLSAAMRQQYHMDNRTLAGDILLQVEAGRRFADTADTPLDPGGHGYLPEHPDMGAVFVAAGPAFKQGKVLDKFSNLEIYPALAQIMGLPLLNKIDGKLDKLAAGLH